MKFEISRTSAWEVKPCPEAFKMRIPNWHIRTVTEEEYNKRFAEREGGPWREKGTKHQITKEGYIKRQEGQKSVWGVEIDDLKQLIAFSKKYGDLIFSGSSIEIYDDYRE